MKQTANAQTDPEYYGAEAVVIPNNIAYGSCTDEHLYRITATFTASAAGGTFALYQGGYNQTQTVAVDGTANQTVSIEFISDSTNNASNLETKLCFAGVAKDTVLTNMSYNVEELPRPVQRLYGTSSGGNSLTVTWAPAAGGLSQNYALDIEYFVLYNSNLSFY